MRWLGPWPVGRQIALWQANWFSLRFPTALVHFEIPKSRRESKRPPVHIVASWRARGLPWRDRRDRHDTCACCADCRTALAVATAVALWTAVVPCRCLPLLAEY